MHAFNQHSGDRSRQISVISRLALTQSSLSVRDHETLSQKKMLIIKIHIHASMLVLFCCLWDKLHYVFWLAQNSHVDQTSLKHANLPSFQLLGLQEYATMPSLVFLSEYFMLNIPLYRHNILCFIHSSGCEEHIREAIPLGVANEHQPPSTPVVVNSVCICRQRYIYIDVCR